MELRRLLSLRWSRPCVFALCSLPMFFLGGVAKYLFVPLAEAVIFAMLASYRPPHLLRNRFSSLRIGTWAGSTTICKSSLRKRGCWQISAMTSIFSGDVWMPAFSSSKPSVVDGMRRNCQDSKKLLGDYVFAELLGRKGKLKYNQKILSQRDHARSWTKMNSQAPSRFELDGTDAARQLLRR